MLFWELRVHSSANVQSCCCSCSITRLYLQGSNSYLLQLVFSYRQWFWASFFYFIFFIYFKYFCFFCQHNCLNSLWHEVLKRSSQNLLSASTVQLLQRCWSLQLHPARRPFEFSELNWPEVNWASWHGALIPAGSGCQQVEPWCGRAGCSGGSSSVKSWQPAAGVATNVVGMAPSDTVRSESLLIISMLIV